MARPRKPTALLEATGAFKKNPARRKARANEPQFSKGVGEPPAHLTGFARDAWLRLAEHLDAVGLMRPAHAEMLAGAANALAVAISADRTLRELGLLVKDNGGVKLNPAYSASLRSWDAFRRFAAEFGLSPRAAAQVATASETKPQTMEDILSQPGPVLMDLSEFYVEK